MFFHKVGYMFVFILCFALGACGDNSNNKGGPGAGKGRPPAPVVVSVTEKRQVADEIEAIGTLSANESVVITSAVADKISSINFEDGQSVASGDVLVTLTKDEQRAELSEAQANLSESLRQLKRIQTIGAKLASKSEIDVAKAKVSVDSGRLEAIKARLADRIITAPFSGVLGFRKISVGALVNPGTEITRLDDISLVNLDFTIPEVYLGSLIEGASVSATSPALDGKKFAGTVTFVDKRIDPTTRAVLVRAKLPNSDLHLRPGMLMNVTLYSKERESLIIGESALLQVGDRAYVYIVDSEMTAQKKSVVLGKRLPGEVVILEGLEPGDKVVVDGTLTLKSGSKVRVVEPVSKEIVDKNAALKTEET